MPNSIVSGSHSDERRRDIKNLPALFAALLVAILFIQSGVDKVVDWKGNFEFLKGHFAKSVLAPMVLPMLATITVLELVTGFPERRRHYLFSDGRLAYS
jgi:uncharacterized membrane protein YphA (DoxX/SURF4 family)